MSDGPTPGQDCWRVERATRASVIIDAEAYFRQARAAMMKARRRIMLIGWDFDPAISLIREEEAPGGPPAIIGDFITWLVERTPELEIFLLRWDVGAMKSMVRPSHLITTLKWMAHPRITVKLDGHHPPAASHHQKIVVIDDCFAFCGGIDMTGERWDSRAHRDDEPGRVLPNGMPYMPWHDATMAIEGAAAAALSTHARNRWKRAGGASLQPVRSVHDCWPDELKPQFHDVDLLIARSAPKMEGQGQVIEIEELYLEHIARAERLIYAESQYFASRKIAEAIAKRLAEDDPPEIVIMNPVKAHGWLEPIAMDTARARLVAALKKVDRHDRLRIYTPHTHDGTPIYVHAKIMIVDDHILRVGSSNLNNRSLRLDTECDVAIDARLAQNSATPRTIAAIRNDLIAEHLSVSVRRVETQWKKTGSLIETIEALRYTGRKNGRNRHRSVRPYEVPELSKVEAWLADNEILDPEGPSEMFETLSKRGLFRRLRRPQAEGPAPYTGPRSCPRCGTACSSTAAPPSGRGARSSRPAAPWRPQ